eukprot:TRINITY_DN65918_c0_g1_i1.p1 TRINITY_DN65918_c0_g1~~TRINITY_DN65918_c0_g1_i1.p1  ORF type:complete len:822 (-),score=141.61 TRINITY_DN65918_c0_g1_i1:144-2609(-)
MQLRIQVRTLSQQGGFVTASEYDFVEALQRTLEERYGIKADSQKVIVAGRPENGILEPGHRLNEYCLGENPDILLCSMLPENPETPSPDFKAYWQPSHLQKKVRNRNKVKEYRSLKKLTLPPDLHGELARQQMQAEAPDHRETSRTAQDYELQMPRSPAPPAHRPLQRVPSAGSGVAAVPRTEDSHTPAACQQQQSSRGQAPSPGPAAAAAAAVAASVAKAQMRSGATAKAMPSPKLGSGKASNPPLVPGTSRPNQQTRSSPATQASLSWSPPLTGTHMPGASTPKAPQPPAGESSPPGTARVTGAPATASAPTVNLSLLGKASSPPGSVRGASAGPGSVNGMGASAMAVAGVTRIRRTDLQRVGRLGVGAFGLVTLEADRRTGRTYALKAVSKGYLAHLRMEYSVINEKRILKLLDTPFVVRLLATYNGREHVYFLLEAALGGELFTTYERLKLYGSETHARFYVACVTEALAHMHERNVIYRDLKPENLLLDVRGFCKVTDMGLAKITSGQTYTMVGTPDYMAPEVIEQSGHTRSVDWWTLGVLLFELLAGHAPFESKTGNAQETYSLVKKGIETVRFPDNFRAEATHLVRVLCHRNPEVRIRTPKLRDHGFFRTSVATPFDWAALCALRMTPPLIPQVRGPRDLTNFRDCEHEDPQAMPYQNTGNDWDKDFEDDELTSGASAAAAQAPMLPLLAGTPSASSTTVCGYRHAPVVAAAGGSAAVPPNNVQLQHQHSQHRLQPRRVGSPPCSPRLIGTASASRLQTTTMAQSQTGPNSARGAWQAHTDRKMGHTGSYVPPIVRVQGNSKQSPPSSPVLGGG